MKINILEGHVLDRLRKLPNESVHCCVTSPPYHGLRNYNTEPQVWGGDSECKHKWGKQQIQRVSTNYNKNFNERWGQGVGQRKQEKAKPKKISQGAFCQKCGCWRGHLGLEPAIGMFVEHIVEICREAWRVLRKDGMLWLVLGDSYAANRSYQVKDSKHVDVGNTMPSFVPSGLKPKDLVMQPERIAWALQADGWYLRDRIVWAKGISFCDSYSGSCMPESITDRCTSAFEFVYMFTKESRYFYDNEAVKEFAQDWGIRNSKDRKYNNPGTGLQPYGGLTDYNFAARGRNLRNVWVINPASFNLEMCTVCERIYKGAEYRKLKTVEIDGKKCRVCRCGEHDKWLSHFAVFPEKLVEPIIKAGTSEHGCCSKCGAPYERVIKRSSPSPTMHDGEWESEASDKGVIGTEGRGGRLRVGLDRKTATEKNPGNLTIGWMPTCNCYSPGQSDWPKFPKIKDTKNPAKAEEKKVAACWHKRMKLIEQYKEHPVVPCTVLDMFVGSGTSGVVAAKLGRNFVGIDLNHYYVKMAKKRIRMAVTGLNTREVKQGQKVMFEEKGLFK